MIMTSETIKEFSTKYGITYMGKLTSHVNDTYIFADVVMVNMRPVPVQSKTGNGMEPKYNMVPALDVVNIFADGVFSFNKEDLIYIGDVTINHFKTLYSNTISLWKNSREEFLKEEKIDVSVQKNK